MTADELGNPSRAAPRHPIVARPLSLRLHPDPVLRRVCCPVEHFDGWLSDVLDEMLSLMRIHEGIGLAAPQVGITRRFFVAQIGRQSISVIDPVIVTRSGSGQMTEGCLSLPEVAVNVQRDLRIEVEGFDPRGQKRRHAFEGLWARVVQHEIDHLDGILICDHENPGGPM